jgi:hypothetical protein
LSGLELVLQEEHGAAMATTLVEGDGSFILEGIRPGDDVLYSNPDELRRSGYRLVPERRRLHFAPGYAPTWNGGVRFEAQPVAGVGPKPPAPR